MTSPCLLRGTRHAYSLYRFAFAVTLISALTIARVVANPAEEPPSPAPVESVESIVVKSEKLDVQTLIDRKVYTVTSDAQSNFGSLGDILNNIPSVDVDPRRRRLTAGDTTVLSLVTENRPANSPVPRRATICSHSRPRTSSALKSSRRRPHNSRRSA